MTENHLQGPLADWLGRTQSAEDVVALNSARRMAALLDQDATRIKVGDELPGHWYQALFTPFDPQSKLAADGHPEKGEFLPPVPLPRRMFAGRRVRFVAPLRIGDVVTRTSSIQGIMPKIGRSGEICFVTVQHAIRGADGRLLVEEEHDIVYRSAPSATPSASRPEGAGVASPQAAFEESFRPDETMLFRYSAITFNAHRIHYDSPYTTGVENHPALVVNGGITTIKLWDMVIRHTGRRIAASQSRNLKPAFANRRVTLRASAVSGDTLAAWAVDEEGSELLRMELTLGASAGSAP
ncbi:acyl-CoA dehydrogenase [Ramlibacter sp. G-1-2-2]|uniref:Acyl-CoA dehydrogenase n=1 Tax=Ramlibacter agri TaxID=2728837 RepID=A0A848GX85_9BURK|nr:MaoC family dehydratase N-terminal domain-containing protein [Ramlibacter agri]NML43276.1 acyl-CoA dehydrogenase [Ramlibacter agri]